MHAMRVHSPFFLFSCCSPACPSLHPLQK
uniref:Uncharacterized protein n=1 Tax=Anguilla anguilla TaxID=7936 RepID=A0A0E9W0U0_ANGAN